MPSATNRFVMPFVIWPDGNGHPLAAGKLYFYLSGTDAPRDTYTTPELTTANANPVVANASGQFPAIFLAPGVAYKVILKDSADAQVWSADPVVAVGGDSNDHINVMTDYGAVGDGVTDDAPAFQNAIDENPDKFIYVPTPPVAYLWETQVSKLAGATDTAGLKMYGDGQRNSIIWCAVPNDAALLLGQTEAFVFNRGCLIEGLSIVQVDPDIEDQVGISIEGCYELLMHDVYMSGFTDDIVKFPLASDPLQIANAQTTNGSAQITVPENLTLHANIHDGDAVTGTGIPTGAIVTQVISPDTIFISIAATATGTVTLTFTGNPDGNSSAFNVIDQCTIERGEKWGIRDYTDGGCVHLVIQNSSIALNRRGNIQGRSGAIKILNNRIYSGVEDGLTECKGPGIYLTSSATTTSQGAYLDFNEFDGNYSANILIDSFVNVVIGAGNRMISHNYEDAKNMRPMRGIRIAPQFTIPDCAIVSGSPIVTNGYTVASVGTTNGSAVITGDFSGATLSTAEPYTSGDRITGTGIPAGTYIATVDGTTGATLTQECTATGTITATVIHGFDHLLVEDMPVAVNPRQKSAVRTTSGSPIITILDPNLFSGNNFNDVSVGDQIVGLASAGASIPDGTTVLTVDSATQVTMSANATFSRDTAQIEISGPEIPPDTTVLSIASDGQFTLSANATATDSSIELYFGRPGNRVSNLTIRDVVFRTDLVGGADALPHPYIGIDWVGDQIAGHLVENLIGITTGAISTAGTPFSLSPETSQPDVRIIDRGMEIQSLGFTPYASATQRYENQLILASTTTALLLDEENFDRSLFAGSSGPAAFELPFFIENVTFVSGDPDITATAMALSVFDGTSGSTTLTVDDFSIGSLTTNGTVTVTRGSGSFVTDGVRVGMYVTGTDMASGARVAAVAALSITLDRAATGSTAGTATLAFLLQDLRHLVAVGATIENANIPASTTALAVTETTITLSAALTGNITDGSIDVFNLSALSDGDALTLATQASPITLDPLEYSSIVGTPTKTAATMNRDAADNGTRSIYARAYKSPTTRLYRAKLAVTVAPLTTGTKVTLSIGTSTIQRSAVFYSNGPGTSGNNETFEMDRTMVVGKGFAIMPYIRIEDSAAREMVAGQASIEFSVIPVT